MGLTLDAATFTLDARRHGASFDRTLMLGRQAMLMSAGELLDLCARFGVELDESASRAEYAEPFLEALGATEVVSMDGSGYEGAEIVHDLNDPIPADLHGRFTAVIDGGTLEHVFNAPVAFSNVASMLETGGYALHINPGNNYLGHGFYQFSPEFYWRALPANGLEVIRVLFKEDEGNAWYEVADPAELGRRVELDRGRPGLLYVLARKVSEPRGEVTQSDYAVVWGGSWPNAKGRRGGWVVAKVARLIPKPLRPTLRRWWNRDPQSIDQQAFRKVEL